MLSHNLGTWTMGQILLITISLLAVLDATKVSTISPVQSTQTANIISDSTQSPAGNNPSDGTDKSLADATEKSPAQSGTVSTVLREPTAHNLTVSETTATPLSGNNETKDNVNQTKGPEPFFTTMPPEGTTSHPPVLQSENSTKTETTAVTVQSPNTVTKAQLPVIGTQVLSSQTTAVPGSITCLGLGSFSSNLQVACFQYEEETTCETLDKQKKEDLWSFLCGILNSTQCNITIHSSEVQPKCILWVPTSKVAEERLKEETSETAMNQLSTTMKLGQISDHQTRSQKTMIALVTCGVLLAAIILAGYFLSNRESWSPGRQRLGEDPYCTETDSQGNTLVSVSAHAQDKPNNGTRENGTGQTVLPAATNGHSTKKQNVSDTEL